jgi:flagellar biosynthesis/type III secretory pathway chaperone
MTSQETLQQHLQVCDELYQLAHEENRHLKEHRRAPDPALLDRKRALLERLDTSLTALRANNANNEAGHAQRQLIEKVRGRILQILQLDKENEQLLLRTSLSRGLDPGIPPQLAPTPSPAMLQKIYARTTV